MATRVAEDATVATSSSPRSPTRVAPLVGADHLEVLVDEDVVGPVDADVVDLVLAVAELDHTVDDAARVGRQRGFGGLGRRGSADDRAGSLLVVGGDLTDRL